MAKTRLLRKLIETNRVESRIDPRRVQKVARSRRRKEIIIKRINHTSGVTSAGKWGTMLRSVKTRSRTIRSRSVATRSLLLASPLCETMLRKKQKRRG